MAAADTRHSEPLLPSHSELDTTRVHVRVIAAEPIKAGRLFALAVVELDVEGVVIRLQGVRVVERKGVLACESPQWRGPDGRWLPAVILPGEVAAAVSELVFAELRSA